MGSVGNTKGSIVVEAAIFLPVFIIAVLSIGFMMKVFYVQEYMQHMLADEVSKIGVEAYSGLIGNHQEEVLMSHINSRISKDGRQLHMKQMPQILQYKYLFNGRFENPNPSDYDVDSDYLVEAILLSKVTLPFKIRFTDDYHLLQRVTVRGWVGIKKTSNPMPFDDMANEDTSRKVYIFPHAGKKFHRESCYIISDVHSPVLLTQALMGDYKPCKVCDAKKLSLGEEVFIFRKSGTHYHSNTCRLIQEYVKAIEYQEAVDMGYQPCKICMK